MLYMIPVLGWVLGFILSFCISIPFYFIWNWLAPIYFYWLPEIYHAIPFFHCVGLFMLMPMIRFALYPRAASQNNYSKDDS